MGVEVCVGGVTWEFVGGVGIVMVDVGGGVSVVVVEWMTLVCGRAVVEVAGVVAGWVGLVGGHRLGGPEWLPGADVSRCRVVLLVVFAVLLPVFALLPQLRARSMERIDAMLRSRAMGALDDKWLAGQNLAWSIDGVVREDAHLSQSCDGGAPVVRPLAPIRHGLVGEATLLLFPSKNALNPVIAILLPEDGEVRDEAVRACASLDIAVETLSADLLPSATPRSW